MLQARPETRTFYGFEKQLSKVYTKAVFSEFRKQLKKSTLFRVTESMKGHPHYLVQYKNTQKVFAWAQHLFEVEADPAEGKYECECMLWEHTGNITHTKHNFTSSSP